MENYDIASSGTHERNRQEMEAVVDLVMSEDVILWSSCRENVVRVTW